MNTGGAVLHIIRIAIILAFLVVILGAFTRLSDAGLGCPDWPGCYGQAIVPGAQTEIDQSNDTYASRPLERSKAWKEMIHRYAAGTLGLLIMVIAILSWKNRARPGQQVVVPWILVGLVLFQALLGMWTVTLLLQPIIVMGHLLGGMSILALLAWIYMKGRYAPSGVALSRSPLWPWALAAVCVVVMQISLGGWTSANYAALICPDFPVCQGSWWPSMDFAEGFNPWHGHGINYEYGVLDAPGRTAIHMSHRIWAVATLLFVGLVAVRALLERNARVRWAGIVLLLALIVQFSLGVANILLRLPVPVAVGHNGVAALLLLSAVALLFHTRYTTA